MDVQLVEDAHAHLGEGPLWDEREERLLWVDIDRGTIHRFDPASGQVLVSTVGQPVGAIALREEGGLLLAVRDGFAFLDSDGPVMIATTGADHPGSRMNDGKVDPQGRFWAGTVAPNEAAGAAALYRLGLDGRAQRVLDGVTVSNGLDWSPDGALMYYIDSPTGGIDVFDFDGEAGAISARRRLIDVPDELGLPDGMTVDADGDLWVAIWGGSVVNRYTADGRLADTIRLPVSLVTSCVFGGHELADLYITSASGALSAQRRTVEPNAGGLFRCRTDARGRPPNRFRGAIASG